MDVDIKCEEGVFKLRACGVIYQNGKILVDKSRRFDGYILIGGHIELGENSRGAVAREVREEVGVDVEVKKLICINENFYPVNDGNKVGHEIAYYFLLQTKQDLPNEDFEYTEIDHGKEITHYYSWIDVEKLKENNVHPWWIGRMILDGTENYFYLTDSREME